ncbi:MAG: methylated-DNA--[protein]-cysteine S-methyltransferase [Defluviitaleaceae bacterium]|nr:methylated-DNA--[protein]-cysteine S-methyltransferase [Defluviitaleaceae bacterium]
MKNGYIYDFAKIKLLITEENGNITNIICRNFDSVTYENKETPAIKQAKQELDEYFAGNLKEFTMPLDLKGTDFQKKVWNALINVPYGETRTYKQLAEMVDSPKGFRAVGSANNRNPVMIVVPCHRIIGTDGKLVGYAGGLNVKEYLLEVEKS